MNDKMNKWLDSDPSHYNLNIWVGYQEQHSPEIVIIKKFVPSNPFLPNYFHQVPKKKKKKYVNKNEQTGKINILIKTLYTLIMFFNWVNIRRM